MAEGRRIGGASGSESSPILGLFWDPPGMEKMELDATIVDTGGHQLLAAQLADLPAELLATQSAISVWSQTLVSEKGGGCWWQMSLREIKRGRK